MNAKPGDRVKVITSDEIREGILMPNEETDSAVIKLDNGYNIGIDRKKVKKIEIIEKYKAKLKNAEQAGNAIKESILDAQEKSVEESFKFIFKEKELKPTIKERLVKFKAQRPFAAYATPFIVLALIITSLFLFKPSVVGYAVLSKETAYNESLSLRINESGAYEWNVKNPGSIKSLKASGSVVGNGTVKVYIEKDGQRYLIYKNK